MKILLVDDSLKHRKAGVKQLTSEGHTVIALSDYTEAVCLVKTEQDFDVALLDLLMPAEAKMLGEKGIIHLGKEISVGYQLSVKLAILGVSKIAVATDTNHHDHPASAMMDWFDMKPININNATVYWMHAPMIGGVKNWLEILNRII